MKNVCLAACLFLCFTGSQAQTGVVASPPAALQPVSTIASLDVQRYLGTWYEVAKYPNWFQKKCVSDTRAEYRAKSPGSLQVINRCRLENGDMDEAIGEARQIGPSTSPKLKVRFAPSWLSLLPFVWGDYWVVDIDERYQLVAVAEPKREYLWVLSRMPKVEPAAYAALLERLQAQGFDLSRLQLTPQL